MTDKEKIDKLTQLKSDCYDCQKCELHKGKFNVISNGNLKTITPECFGAGNANAEIMVIAEAPGEHEAIEKRPLIGLAGHNFDDMLKYIDLNREEIYISNVVKCRPTDGRKNRAPTDKEKKACEEFIKKEIKIVSPKLIIALGNHSMHFLTGKMGITEYNGKILEGQYGKTFVIFHPSPFNINNPNRKKEIYKALENLRREVK